MHALDRNCREISGFPVNVEDRSWSSPALYDSRRRRPARDLHRLATRFAGGFIDWSGGEFRALDWANGSVRELWKRQVDDVIMSSPAIGDIDGDGRLEAVVGGGDYYNRGDGRQVCAWHLDDGSTVPGWPRRRTGGVVFSSPALGDLTGDGVAGSRDRQPRRDRPRVPRQRVRSIVARRLRFINGPGQHRRVADHRRHER